MNDALAVGGVERVGDLEGKFEQTVEVEGRAVEQFPQRMAFQALHGDEYASICSPTS